MVFYIPVKDRLVDLKYDIWLLKNEVTYKWEQVGKPFPVTWKLRIDDELDAVAFKLKFNL